MSTQTSIFTCQCAQVVKSQSSLQFDGTKLGFLVGCSRVEKCWIVFPSGTLDRVAGPGVINCNVFVSRPSLSPKLASAVGIRGRNRCKSKKSQKPTEKLNQFSTIASVTSKSCKMS